MVTEENSRVDNQKRREFCDDKVQVRPPGLTKCVTSPGAKITLEGTPRHLADPCRLAAET